jgi:hypothetical protein
MPSEAISRSFDRRREHVSCSGLESGQEDSLPRD